MFIDLLQKVKPVTFPLDPLVAPGYCKLLTFPKKAAPVQADALPSILLSQSAMWPADGQGWASERCAACAKQRLAEARPPGRHLRLPSPLAVVHAQNKPKGIKLHSSHGLFGVTCRLLRGYMMILRFSCKRIVLRLGLAVFFTLKCYSSIGCNITAKAIFNPEAFPVFGS